MIFQGMFAVITPALIIGAFAERIKFSSFLVFVLLWTTLVYDPLAHWLWGMGGWLRNLGALDFAGGIVVHVSSGISALVMCIMLGKRIGYARQPFRPHNLPFTVLGACLLWFGWFGFNAGSALAANGLAANAFIATQIATAAAGLTWALLEWQQHGAPTILGAQLISHVLGGVVCRNEHEEIGWFPVTLTEEGGTSEIFACSPQTFSAFHWHADTFTIPQTAQRLASSDACRNQAFAYDGGRVVALQFHIEVDRRTVTKMAKHLAKKPCTGKYVQSPADITDVPEERYELLKATLYGMLDAMERLS